MRTLKLQVQVSLDGYVADGNGQMDWMEWNWDDALKEYVNQLTMPVDCILLGRKLADGFIPYWETVAANAADPEFTAAKKFTETSKVVFTKTLAESVWSNTTLAKGELVAEITALKEQEGGDIIVYGGATFVSSLIEHGLIDEYYFFVNPTAVGEGLPIFKGFDRKKKLSLVKSTPFDCGIVVLHYLPAKP